MSRLILLYLLSLTVRSFAFAAVAELILLRSRRVHVRHAAWTLVLCSLFLMPVTDTLLPSAMVPAVVPEVIVPIREFVIVPTQAVALPLPIESVASVEQARDWWRVALILTALVSSALLLRLVLVLRQVLLIRKSSRPVSALDWDDVRTSSGYLLRSVSLRESGSIAVPLTIGFWRPVVILPLGWEHWEGWKLRAVLTHELTHIRRFDWAITIVAAVAKSLFWFNPLAWWLERKLSTLSELASDEACVRASGDPRRYAETLLHFAAASRNGHRWLGGVAMAHHKISMRIERVLALRRPGTGVLSYAGWTGLLLVTLPALYLSAATQSPQTVASAIPLVDIPQVLRHESPLQLAKMYPVQQPSPAAPAPETRQPQTTAPVQATPQGVPAQSPPISPPVQPAVVNPDLVGEIRLILAPVDQPTPLGQVQVQTRTGTTQWTGTAVWNVRNSALSPESWNTNRFWNANNAFAFSLVNVEGRKLLFEDSAGSTFSYGCADCEFLVWESGVGLRTANAGPGILFRLGADGKSLSVTCRSTECRVALGSGGNTFSAFSILSNAETRVVNLVQSAPGPTNSTGKTCFSVFGSVKLDGTPFTEADCVGGTLQIPTMVFFSVTR